MKYVALYESILDNILGNDITDLISTHYLTEGGNVFKAPQWTKENPQMLTARILKQNVPMTVKYLERLTNLPVRQGVMGSTGISESSGDIDIAVDQNKITKENLIQTLVNNGVNTEDIKKTGDSVHYKCPIQGSQKGEFVQTDFMFVPNVPFAVWSATVTPGSGYKGMYKQQLMADLTRTVNPNWKWNHFKGVIDRNTNETVFGFDPDAIAKGLLGQDGKRQDLESVEGILKALSDLKHEKALSVRDAYRQTLGRDPKGPRIPDEVTEATKPTVGRKYQHIEDLVLSNGALGALHAIERMEHMIREGGSIELKWDGMPVVYWGRDKDGTFRMIPKNAWQYLKSGKNQTASGATTLMSGPKDIANFIMGTGSGDPESRKEFAVMFANLWPYFEKISPKVGYVEGGLLFYPGTKFDGKSSMPQFNPKLKTWDFKPNITTFHIPIDSDLGRKIGTIRSGTINFNTQLMVAVTGYYSELGSSDEQRLPNAEQLSKPGIEVQGTTYVMDAPKIGTDNLDRFKQVIKARSADIDRYLSPKPGLTSPAGEIYTYLNQRLRTEGLTKDFPTWVQTNLSEKKQQHLLSDEKGMLSTLQTIEDINKLKMQIINVLKTGMHGGIKQTDPEGYAQAHPGAKFQYDIPGQFVKMIDQLGWKPRKIDEATRKVNKNTAVVGWGRGMGHKGHMYLASAVITTAGEVNGDPYFILSRTVGNDDPLTPQEKLQIYRKVFPNHKNIFHVATEEFPTLPAMLATLKDKGYTNAIVVLGKDQKPHFQFLTMPAKKTGKIPVEFDTIKVISRQETNDPHATEEGPRATPMREILKSVDATYDDKFAKWREDMPSQLSDDEVDHYMRVAAERMGYPVDNKMDNKINEADPPSTNLSPIPGTPRSLTPRPSQEELEKYQEEMAELRRFMGRR